MPLRSFVDELPETDRSMVVVNREEPEQVTNLLMATFPERDVPVIEERIADADANQVLLVEDEEVVAQSPMSEVEEQLLFVNSDIYRTGTRELDDVTLPDVLLAMDDVPFHLRGYPESDREKLVLIAISRLIERRAWEAGAGTLRSSFQRLSRIEDEIGTYEVYSELAATDLDLHLYGVPDELPEPDIPTVVHAGRTEDLRRSWFVLFDPPADADADPIGLLAWEESPRNWVGFWSYDAARLRRVQRYIEERL